MLKPYQRYVDSGEINTTVTSPAATVEAIAAHEREAGASIDMLDGLTVEHGDWWYNVRPSNTEPLAAPQRGGEDRRALCGPRRRGAGTHCRQRRPRGRPELRSSR